MGGNEPRESDHEEAIGLQRGFVQEQGHGAQRLWRMEHRPSGGLRHVYPLGWGTCEYQTGTHHISKEDSGTPEERHRLPLCTDAVDPALSISSGKRMRMTILNFIS